MNIALPVMTVLVLLAGCPGTRKPLVPRVPDVPTNGDAQARHRFEEAKSRFLRDATQAEDFKQIVEDFPNDPIVPWAELYAGIASVKGRNFIEADKQLTKVAQTGADSSRDDLRNLARKARLYLGITKNYEGDAAGARALLADTEKAVETDDERTEWLAAVAYSVAASDRPLDALHTFDELWDRVNPTERAVILDRIEGVVAAADPNSLARMFDELPNRRGPSIALVGSRLALIAEASGDPARGADLRERIGRVREAVGLPRTVSVTETGPATSGAVDSGLVGAVLPFGGRSDSVAQRASEGLGVAAGAANGKGVVAIELRTAQDAAAAGLAVDQLAGQNVIAIVGPIGDLSVDAGAARAETLGVPLLSLTTHPVGRANGKFVFHMRHSPEARARVLARRAMAKGIKTFALLSPVSAYGTATTAAFVAEVQNAGGQIIQTVTYPSDTKSFAVIAGKLTKGWDAVFVPADSDTLALIAPAIAAAGNIPKPYPFPKKVGGGRGVLLLSTAEDLKEEFLLNVGRHGEGALLAPGYYPDDAEPANKAFVDAFFAAYGKKPGATSAYAYDAAQLAAAAGGSGRAGLASTLGKDQLSGVTGTIKFDASHQRSDDGIVYTIVEETGGPAIRVAR